MAALIHHHCHHHPLAATVAVSIPSSTTKPLGHSQVTSFLSPSKTTISLPSSKAQIFPSFSLNKNPSFQHIFTPVHLPNPQPLSNHELWRLLKLSIDYADVQLNKAVHASVLKIQHGMRLFNSLISSYIELGNPNYAERVFNSLPDPDVVSFTAMISFLAKSSREDEAVELFFEMRCSGIVPNAYAFVSVLTACMRLLDFELGSQVHAYSIKTSHLNCSYVANALMALYSKCGNSDCVVKLFDNMSQRDNASWNTLISCLVKGGMYDSALELFQNMIVEGFRADYFTLSSVLVACTRQSLRAEGSAVHAYTCKIGHESTLSVRNALIGYYANCGRVEDVQLLFDSMPMWDVFTGTQMINAYMGFRLIDSALGVLIEMPEKNLVTYNAVLAGFCQNNDGLRALKFFRGMVGSGMDIDDFTLTSSLNACGLIKNSRLSAQIQAFVHKIGTFGTNGYIQAAMLDMCTKCGRMSDAQKMFDRLLLEQRRSSVMLTTMICGYARMLDLDRALFLISKWLCDDEGSIMDEVELASILGVCGDLGFLKLGEQFHAYALKRGFSVEVGVGNSIISMCSKCGNMDKAVKVFDTMSEPDIISWNSVLTGYILNRQGEECLHIWEKMQSLKIHPDRVSCALIITAYRHTNSSSVEHCRKFLLSMKSIYGIEPDSDHYSSLVSVLSRWGFLEEAEEVIKKMSFDPAVWRALLDGCRVHKNSTIGRRAAKNILSIEPEDPSTYVLKSNLYSASGRWHCAELAREKMKESGLRKSPARSWVVRESLVHSFFGRDKSHVQSRDIYGALDVLFSECSKAGYVPDTSFVLQEVEEHQKVNFLLHHSGKVAAAYGVVKARPGEPVKVFKNVNLCGDCHTFLKYVSAVTGREIQVRDASGFHRFGGGECSCRDCW